MVKIAFYVSRNASRLKKFIEYCNKEKLDIIKMIHVIITDNIDDIQLKEICLKNNIDFHTFSNKTFKNTNLESSNYVKNVIDELNIDYLFIYCDAILKGAILSEYQNKIINFHPSLLPAHKGLFAVDQAIKAKTFLFGNSAHFVDEGIDTGPVIMQSILHSSNFKDYDDVLDLQVYMIVQILKWLEASRIACTSDGVLVEDADYSIDSFIPNLEFKID